jgi:hypothetical protein
MSYGCVTVQLSTVNSRGGAPNTPRHGIRNELRMQYLGYTLEDYQGEEYPVPHTYPPLPPRWGLMLKAVLGVLVALIAVVLVSTNAHAQDMSAELEEFNATCFTEAGEFEPTDGCYEYAESLGLGIDNINESMDKGCVLSDLYEDYSCKGPSAPSSSSVSEQEEVSEQGCVAVDMTDPKVSGEGIDVLTKYFGFDTKADNDDQLYSPECFEQGIVPFDFESMRSNPCYDVLGNSEGDVWAEYIGCPSTADDGSVGEQSYTPLTQQGTPAPADWCSHVVPLKPAAPPRSGAAASKSSSSARATTSTLSTTNPYLAQRVGYTGRSQGQVVSESKRTEAHAKASKAESKLKAQQAEAKAKKKSKR